MKKSEIITLKDKQWIKRQKHAGQVVAQAHREIYSVIHGTASNCSLRDLGEIASTVIQKNNCTPTFLNYKGFPSSICTSLNKELVHGSCNRDCTLKNGDILKVDIGATFEGAIGDCAVTYVYGKTSDRILGMLISCQKALNDAISIIKPENCIGSIGKAIWDRSRKDGFGVITDFGGHGIDYNILHAPPFVSNKAKSDEGVRIQSGMSIAIEPMFVLGKNTHTKIMKDKWTVVTADIGCHFEHSVVLDENNEVKIMTEHNIDAKSFRSRG